MAHWAVFNRINMFIKNGFLLLVNMHHICVRFCALLNFVETGGCVSLSWRSRVDLPSIGTSSRSPSLLQILDHDADAEAFLPNMQIAGMLGLEAWPRPRGRKTWPRPRPPPRGLWPRPRGFWPRPRGFWPRASRPRGQPKRNGM